MKTFADLIQKEAERFTEFVYCSKPYSCGIAEACMFFKDYLLPDEKNYKIVRDEKQTTISVKPVKGSGRRKEFIVKLWVA